MTADVMHKQYLHRDIFDKCKKVTPTLNLESVHLKIFGFVFGKPKLIMR